MTLTPVKPKIFTPVFKAGPGFNHKAAQAFYDIVMKMDDDSAAMFCDIVISDVTEELIEKNLSTLQRTLDHVVSKRVEEIKKATLRAAMKGDGTEFAKALSVITKAGPAAGSSYVHNEDDFEQLHPRGDHGRFRTKVTHSQTKPLHPKTAKAVGIKGLGNARYSDLNSKEKAQYQDEYRQLANFLHTVHQSTSTPGDSSVYLHFKDKTGREWTEANNGTKVDASMLNPAEHSLVGIEAVPTTLSAGGAAFSLQSALGNTGPGTGAAVRGINRLDQGGMKSFSSDWNKETDGRNTNAQLYNRITSGSQFVGGLAPPGSKVQLAARAAQIVGDHGAEAESVIGPTARKTAYRYRGTEKQPDKHIASLYHRAINSQKALDIKGSPAQQAARRMRAENRNPTFMEQEAGRRVIVDQLRHNLPNRQLYELQLASGNTPPSEGIMINRKGQISAQAVGYGDDHYLPFNLKNLKSLKGGQYIRTRSVGGPTAEDIYTGLIAGAKQVTVVSRSGTFTVTFDDSFRGGRRHNDKARRMTRRYEQILDAVQSGEVKAKGIDPRIQGIIRDQVKQQYIGQDAKTIRNVIKEREAEYRSNPELSDEDEELISRLRMAKFGQDSSPEANTYVRQITGQILRTKKVNFTLDGDGYASALDALYEQFPYYLERPNSQVLDEEEVANSERDRGYVEPGRNRPTEARAGLYGTKTNPGTKFSASHTNYQRGRFTRHTEADATPAEGGEKKAETADDKDPKKVADRVVNQITHRKAADDLFDAMNTPGIPESWKAQHPWLNNREEFNRMMDGSEGTVAVDRLVSAVDAVPAGQMPETVRSAARRWKMSSNVAENYIPGRWPPSPVSFPEPAYSPGANLDVQQAEFRKINSNYGRTMTEGGNLGSLNDTQLKAEHDALQGVLSAIKADPEAVQAANAQGADLRRRMAAQFFPSAAPDSVQAFMEKPERIQSRLESIQRMRKLHEVGHWPDGSEQVHTGRVPELNQGRRTAADIFNVRPDEDDVVDAIVVPEGVRTPTQDESERFAMANAQLQGTAKHVRSYLANKDEVDWNEHDYELRAALDEYESNPPADSGQAWAAYDRFAETMRQGRRGH